MDNLTHSLTGLALARAGLDRFCPRAVWLLMLSANAPDGDIVVASQGSFPYFEAHRGYSHSLLCLPLVALLSMAVVAAILRERLPWLRAWLLCTLGVASHLLLDLTNSYGIRLSLPFSARWYYLDLKGLYDIWILGALLLAAFAPLLAVMVNREIGVRNPRRGRGFSIAALAFFVVFDLGRFILHNRTVAQFDSLLFENSPALLTAALPDSYNPLRWTVIVETRQSFLKLNTNPLLQPDLSSAEVFYKSPLTSPIQGVKNIDPFRYFAYFARFPIWTGEPVFGKNVQGTRLDLTDLRFGAPGRGSFHCIGLFDHSGHLIEKWFTLGSGSDLGLASQ